MIYFRVGKCVLLRKSPDISSLLPVYEAVQQLFAGAVLGHQHQVPRRDVGFVQSHDLFVVKGFQDLVLLQDFLLALLAVRNDLCHVDFTCRVLAALSYDSETTPGKIYIYISHRKPKEIPQKSVFVNCGEESSPRGNKAAHKKQD